MKFEVGQKVWVVYTRRYLGKPHWDVVTKVGRKWATIGDNFHHRIDMTGCALDGGSHSSPGRVYATQTEHAAVVERDELWQSIHNLVGRKFFHPPKHMDISKLKAVLSMIEGPDEA